jgi:hypothetical protein
MFASLDTAKPDIENIRDSNFVAVKLTTVQVTTLSLDHKICKICRVCFATHGMAEGLYTL